MKNQALMRLMEMHKFSQEDLAEVLEITRAAIQAWHTNGIPVRYCKVLECMSGGTINRREFRPDDWKLYWD